MKPSQPKEWNRLDNAAKIFPPNSNKRDTKTFRFACQLKEPVCPQLLQDALDQTAEQFPIFCSVMKHGFFWCYLERSSQRVLVTEENLPPCSPLYDYAMRNVLFRVSYYGPRINLEVYHALTDGTGAMEFLKFLVSQYLKLRYPKELREFTPAGYDASQDQQTEDSFLKYYDPANKFPRPKNKVAYRIKGEYVPVGNLQVIEGCVPVKETLALAKSYRVTLSVFLTALLLQSIGETMTVRQKRRPVVSAVPVNLRNFFPSETARNFFGVINAGYHFGEGSGQFEEIVQQVKEQFARELTKEKLAARIHIMAALECNPVLRVVPWALKNPILHLANSVTKRYTTTSISNLGKVEMPPQVQEYIQQFHVFVSTDKVQACVCSYRDKLTINFTSAFVSTAVPTAFFRKLAEWGIPVEITATREEEGEVQG